MAVIIIIIIIHGLETSSIVDGVSLVLMLLYLHCREEAGLFFFRVREMLVCVEWEPSNMYPWL